MNIKKYIAAFLVICIVLLSGCYAKKAGEAPTDMVPDATEITQAREITQPQETTVATLHQDERMDLLSNAEQTPEEVDTYPTTSEDTNENESAPTKAVQENTVSTATEPVAEQDVFIYSGNENQLPMG